MSANFFKTFRKSYVVNLLFSSILSNVVVFGQPVQEMIISHYNSKTKSSNVSGSSRPSKYSTANPMISAASSVHTSYSAHSVSNNKETSMVFYAEEAMGSIGVTSEADIEELSDNFFSINIPQQIDLKNYQATLSYEVYGVSSASQTTKSINSNPSYGGKFVTVSNKWTSVTENVACIQLQNGLNEVFFNRRVDELYKYKIKNLRIELKEKKKSDISLTKAAVECNAGIFYLMGTADPNVTKLTVRVADVPINNGVFENIFNDFPKDLKELEVLFTTLDNVQHALKLPIVYQDKVANHNFSSSPLELSGTVSTAEMLATAPAIYGTANVSIDKTQLTVCQNKVIVQGLNFKDIRGKDVDLKNVTAGNFAAYRISNLSNCDSLSMRVKIKYDTLKIPDGYTAKDIKTFYYDRVQRNWKEYL